MLKTIFFVPIWLIYEQGELDDEAVWWTSGDGECEDEVVWAAGGEFDDESG